MYTFGRVRCQFQYPTETAGKQYQVPQPPTYKPPTNPAITGIPNINTVLVKPPPFLKLLVAVLYGYKINRRIKPTPPIKKCPEGWFRRDQRCYFFSDKKTSWYGAESLCRLKGGYLAIPDTEEENNFLKETSTSEEVRLQGAPIPHFSRWIGLRSLDGSTIQKIITNELLTFTDFVPGHLASRGLTSEPCVHMDYTSSFLWKVEKCHRGFLYICERHLHFEFKYTV